jgi:Phycobilisome Linker polypeptide
MPIRVEKTAAESMVKQLYRDLFGREPEREVLRGLVTYFGEGRLSTRTQLLRMLKSDEFYDKRLRNKTPEEMARALYQYVLGRPPESNEALKGAADQLGTLGWRVQIDVMINSEEYLGRFGDDNVPTVKERL